MQDEGQMKELNLKEKISDSGITLIEASAGTGKTYSISNIFLHFILKGKQVSEILVVTFTEDATKELRDRIRTNLSQALSQHHGSAEKDDPTISSILDLYTSSDIKHLLELALVNFDQAAIFTIHSFCKRMLKENAFESHSTFDMELIQDDKKIVEEAIHDFIRTESYVDQVFKEKDYSHLKDLTKYIQLIPPASINRDQALAKAAQLNKLDSRSNDLNRDIITYLAPLKNLQSQLINQTKSNQFLDELSDLVDGLKGVDYNAKLELTISGLLAALPKFPKGFKSKVSKFSQSVITAKGGPDHEFFRGCQSLCDSELGYKELTEELKQINDEKKLIKEELHLYSKSAFAAYFQASFQKKKDLLNVLTFDDLINKLHDELQNEGAHGPLHQIIRNKFKVALVDEFQDTDPIQYKIFKSLFGDPQHSQKHAFYMIGDPKQSIYRFRGADIFAYLNAKNDADEAYTLKDNYRSEQSMVDAVNSFFDFKGKNEAFAYAPEDGKAGITFEVVGAKADKTPLIIEGHNEALQLHWLIPDELDPVTEQKKTTMRPLMTKRVSEDIINLLNLSQDGKAYFGQEEREPLKPGDICVLVNINKQAREIKKLLNSAGIPAVVAKSGNIFDTEEAQALECFLDVILNPKESTITPLLLSCFFNFTAKELKSLDDKQRFDYLIEFKDYKKEWERHGFLRSLQKFIDKHNLYTEGVKKDQGERHIANLFQLREILHSEEQTKGLGPAGLLRFIKEKMQSKDKDDEQYLQRLETDEDAVKLMTIHKSKGLEFPIVFCPFMWEESYMETSEKAYGEKKKANDFAFHKEDGQAMLSIDPSSPKRELNRKLWRREILGDKLRLLYVAMTRSANRCYLYWGNVANQRKTKTGYSSSNQSPSVFEYLVNETLKGSHIAQQNPTYLSLGERRSAWEQKLAGSNSNIGFQELLPVKELSSCHYKPKKQQELKEPQAIELSFPLWMDGSYSALIRSHAKVQFTPDLAPLNDEDERIKPSNQDEKENPEGFFAFPRGAMPGTCIHEIFEHINFQSEEKWDEVISDKLKKYYLHGPHRSDHEDFFTQRINDCKDMLRTVLGTQLKNCDFSLSAVPFKQRMDELEFHYPVKDINLHKLQAIFSKHYQGTDKQDYAQDLSNLNYNMEEGYLNGSIDLTFQHDGKFYIVDWKSNYLGSKSEYYHEEELNKAVREHFYFLQYHIYSLALHLYLESNLQDYDYENHFGACIYAFVRGFKDGTNYGMHYDRVPLDLINDLKDFILTGAAHV
ncbi:exodeoxyribonuclease V subunit beta [Lentisphaera marina]|uniref:exodeoxyribonuclease V subunit beta n=1 Tax=Lentisphaera marina TaxID=1111041 RepID=UPI0023665CD2|nr:exodeoxyribonuclease V subunit beta [Lentisphaera marina]MDD7986672.1 exodeoxyribonuclease V subunit beta [Lentisphaera marina]